MSKLSFMSLIVFLLAGLSATTARAFLSVKPDARDISVRSSVINTDQELITVDIAKSHKQISAIFDLTTDDQTGAATGDKMWKRLWFSKGSASLNLRDQRNLRAAFELGLDKLNPLLQGVSLSRAQASVDFLAYFMPLHERIHPFDSAVDLPKGFMGRFVSDAAENKYTMICDAIGKRRTATYTDADGTVVDKILVVGAVDTKCRGRCGAGCEQMGQWRHNQYTQECFNHDACHNSTGRQLGPCEPEFWKAAPGYLFAPDCKELAVPVGPVDDSAKDAPGTSPAGGPPDPTPTPSASPSLRSVHS